MEDDLQRIREWANAKLATGEEPPWAWYQYMKLREALDAILSGMAAVTKESSPQSGQHQETHLRLVVANCLPNISQLHQPEISTPLPM